MTDEHDGQRFDRLPETAADRTDDERPTRQAVVNWWTDRFGIQPDTFDSYSFWERGRGKIWIAYGEEPTPIAIQGLGMTFLRTRGDYWKPTTNAVQRFGNQATRNVISLDTDQAQRFIAGEDQTLDWDGDWGYLIAAQTIAGEQVPLGVGLYVHGELRSMIPKGRRRQL